MYYPLDVIMRALEANGEGHLTREEVKRSLERGVREGNVLKNEDGHYCISERGRVVTEISRLCQGRG
jgi:hypothetical protein